MAQSKILLCLGAGPSATRRAEQQGTLHIHAHDDPLRGRIESYIQQRYRQRYGARLTEWLPMLVSLQIDGEILAAAGYRGGSAPLFLERYLSAPIEQYILDHGAPVSRHRIVEAGHLAAMRPGAGRLLVPLFVRHLRGQGFDWAVSTLTSELHHLFSRMGLAHQPLSAATPDHLAPAERENWGNYYAHSPKVYAGSLASIIDRFPECGA